MRLNVPHKNNRLKASKSLAGPCTLGRVSIILGSTEVGRYESCRLVTYTRLSKYMDKRQRRRYFRELDTMYQRFLLR